MHVYNARVIYVLFFIILVLNLAETQIRTLPLTFITAEKSQISLYIMKLDNFYCL